MNEQDGSNALAVIQQIPPTESAVAQWRRTTDIASLVRAVVMQSTVTIQGRKYLTVAGFQAVANAFGCVASARDVVRVEGGWQAVGEVRRMSDGMVLSTGVGFLGDDEKTWQSRPQFSKMAMAQTRACGRALRAAFAFMAPVIDGNLQTTPYEEIEVVQGSVEPPAPTGVAGLKAKLATPKASPPKASDFGGSAVGAGAMAAEFAPKAAHDRSLSFAFGKSKGIPLGDMDEPSLKFYEGCLLRDLDDASRSKWHDKTRQQLTTLRAELAWRGL